MKSPSASTLEFARILANIRPLAEFYRAHKPQQQHIFLFANDYALLAKHPKKAQRFGFLFHGKQIKFGEFTLLSEAQNG